MKKVLDTLDVSWNQFLTSVNDDVSWKKMSFLAKKGTEFQLSSFEKSSRYWRQEVSIATGNDLETLPTTHKSVLFAFLEAQRR